MKNLSILLLFIFVGISCKTEVKKKSSNSAMDNIDTKYLTSFLDTSTSCNYKQFNELYRLKFLYKTRDNSIVYVDYSDSLPVMLHVFEDSVQILKMFRWHPESNERHGWVKILMDQKQIKNGFKPGYFYPLGEIYDTLYYEKSKLDRFFYGVYFDSTVVNIVFRDKEKPNDMAHYFSIGKDYEIIGWFKHQETVDTVLIKNDKCWEE